MEIVYGNSTKLLPQLMNRAARYRHKVFVEKLGWQLNCHDLLENDQFDRPDTIYVIAKNDNNDIVGIARLLPTTRPYLLGEVFPQLLNGIKPPESEDIWELSRFAAVDFEAQQTTAMGQFSSSQTIELLNAAIECARSYGAKRLITVSPVGVERLMRKLGLQARRAGPPMVTNHQSVCAYWIELNVNDGVTHEH
jgi:N-acyl-L-homoserine lactone synthetase